MLRLVLFFIVGMVATGGTSMAENLSTCSVDTVPIQIVRGTKHLDVGTLTGTQIDDFPPGFTAFVSAVTEHLVTKLSQNNLCLNSVQSKDRSLLQFVSWPIISSHSASLSQLEARASGVCRISSPWIDIAIERKPFHLYGPLFALTNANCWQIRL